MELSCNQSVKDRIMLFISQSGITKSIFERKSGLSNGYLNQLRNAPKEDKISNILKAYPEINRIWLLTGEGEMLQEQTQDTTFSENYGMSKAPQSNATVSKKPTSSLPLIPIEAVAGFPGDDETGVKLVDCEQYRVPEFVAKGAQFLIRVSGSSMYPKYSNGDILACRKIDSVTFFQWGKVYVLDTNQGALVKRLFEDEENQNNVICHSDNHENYPNFKIPKSEIRSLSIVLGVIRLE